MPERVRLILLHWRAPEEVGKAIEAFSQQTLPVEIVIVDNGSSPEQLDRLKARAGAVRFVELSKNIGFGPGMNAGLRDWLADKNAGEFVVLAPHDALPEPDAVEKLIGELVRRPNAGISCAEYGEPKKPGYHWLKGPGDLPAVPGKGWESVPFPNGTLMAYRRACLEQIGLFDERYFAYTEEYEIALRARRAGWDVGIVWSAIVKNPMAAASSQVRWYLLIRNQLLAVYQTSGRLRALALTVDLVGGSIVRRTIARNRRNDGDRGNVRWRAIRDFWRGRLGKPPMLSQ